MCLHRLIKLALIAAISPNIFLTKYISISVQFGLMLFIEPA